MTRTVRPYSGDYARYGLGPEHIFFDTFQQTASLPTSPVASQASRVLLGRAAEDVGRGRGGGLADLGMGPAETGKNAGRSSTAEKSTSTETDPANMAMAMMGPVGVMGKFGREIGFNAIRDTIQHALDNEIENEHAQFGRSFGMTPNPESVAVTNALDRAYQDQLRDYPTPPEITSDTYGGEIGDVGDTSGIGGGSGLAGGEGAPWARGGRVMGQGGGLDDLVPAMIDGVQPARLSTDEFVIPADVVSAIGDGSSTAGSRKLYELIKAVRQEKTGKTKQPGRLRKDLLEVVDGS